MNKVMIAIPSGDMAHMRFVSSLVGLMATKIENTKIFYANEISSRITMNRNSLVERAIKEDMTHLLFIDSDMTFHPFSLGELLSHDKDIVGASACKRKEGEQGVIGTPLNVDDFVTSKRLVEMEFIGLPFTLIRVDVFKKLPQPWFAEPFNEIGEVVPEDNFFCIRAREAGYQIWCDKEMTFHMGHVGVKEYKVERIQHIPKLKEVA